LAFVSLLAGAGCRKPNCGNSTQCFGQSELVHCVMFSPAALRS
jgi:hypothetical protein